MRFLDLAGNENQKILPCIFIGNMVNQIYPWHFHDRAVKGEKIFVKFQALYLLNLFLSYTTHLWKKTASVCLPEVADVSK